MRLKSRIHPQLKQQHLGKRATEFIGVTKISGSLCELSFHKIRPIANHVEGVLKVPEGCT